MHGQIRRVLVAGHLNLDAPLRGLHNSQEDQHEIVRDATLASFEFLIEAAIDQSVDALILQGQLFSEPPTLRTCSTFREGIETLLDAGIEVLWVVQKPQEKTLLEELHCLPAGVTLLTPQHQHCLLFEAHSRTLPTERSLISCDLIDQQTFPAQEWGWTEEQTLLRLGITHRAIGHLAHGSTLNAQTDHFFQVILSGEPLRRHTARHHHTIYHAPGCLQSLDETLTGACSATLLKIDAQGEVELQTLDTSHVQWETLEFSIEPQESGAEWMERAELEFLELLSRLENSPVALLQLQWQIRGSLEQLKHFSSADLIEQFSTLFAAADRKLLINHDVQLVPLFSGQLIPAQDFLEDHLEEQFLQHLGEQVSSFTERQAMQEQVLMQLLQDAKGRTALPVKSLLGTVNAKTLGHRSAELGLRALRDAARAS